MKIVTRKDCRHGAQRQTQGEGEGLAVVLLAS